jgi:hypothetical protein
MSDKEKARQELIEAYIECCKKRKKIESVEVSKGLDGHDGAKLKQITLDFIEIGKEIIKKYQIDGIDFSREEMFKIEKSIF